MKRYDELTHEELIVLTEEEIHDLIDLEIAHEGILPVDPPKELTLEAEGIIKEDVAFCVGGLLFKNEEDAQKVINMELITSNSDYSMTNSYNYKWLEPMDSPSITKEMYYKQHDIVKIKDIVKSNADKKDEFAKEEKVFKEYSTKKGEIVDRITDTLRNAQAVESDFDFAIQMLKKYLKLSEGNAEIALKFFQDAFKGKAEVLKRVNLKYVRDLIPEMVADKMLQKDENADGCDTVSN